MGSVSFGHKFETQVDEWNSCLARWVCFSEKRLQLEIEIEMRHQYKKMELESWS